MQQLRPTGMLNGWPFVGVAAVAILASVLAAMTATSFDRTAQMIGPRALQPAIAD